MNFRKILDKLGIDTKFNNGIYTCPCPIHDGDNPNGFSLYENSGAWNCWTHQCEEEWGCSIKGLVHAVLSKRKGNKIEWGEVEDFIKNENLYISDITRVDGIKSFSESKIIINRKKFLNRIEIPSPYYLNRDFSASVLKRYDIGVCTDKEKVYYKGTIIPIYNSSYTGIVAYSVRNDTDIKEQRWRHMAGQWRSLSLYNIWFAKSYIKKEKVAILCESPAKVWRLVEAGFNNCLGIFGTKFSEGQKKLLSTCGAESIVILMDNDEAGKQATANIAKSLKSLYNIIIPKVSFIDLDETPKEIVQKELSTQI